MFSATMPDKIEDLAKTLLKDPVIIKLAVSKPAEKIKQSAYVCYETQKLGIIQDIFKQGDLKRVIIFSGKKQKVKAINRALQRMHVNSGEMHSDLDQAERDQMLYKFKSGQIDVLVATDIVARGIDIDDIAMVINFDVPHDAEDYVHRIGRTARADRDGVAITFINEEDVHYFKQIEKLLEKEVEKTPLPEELGEGPEYKEGRGQRTTAKSRRRKNRDATAHKRKPRNNENERKPKQPKEPKEATQAENAPKQEAAVENKADEKKQNRRRQPRNKSGNEGENNAKAGNNAGNGKAGNRRDAKATGNGKDAKAGNGKDGKAGNSKDAKAGNGKDVKAGNGKDGKAGNGKEAKAGNGKDAKAGNGKDAKAGNGNKQRHKKPRQPKKEGETAPMVSTKYSKTAGMSPVVNPSKDSTLKQILKKPLSWIKKLGK